MAAGGHAAYMQAGQKAHMGAEEVVALRKQAGGGHAGRAPQSLLAGLEHQQDLAPQAVTVCGEQPGGADADGGVGVVAAGVHTGVVHGAEALGAGDMSGVVRLLHVVAVNVHADADGGPGQRPLDHGQAAGVAPAHVLQQVVAVTFALGAQPAGLQRLLVGQAQHLFPHVQLFAPAHRKAQLLQLGDDAGGGAELRPSGLGIAVEVTAQVDQILGKLGHIDAVECHIPVPLSA